MFGHVCEERAQGSWEKRGGVICITNVFCVCVSLSVSVSF
jgi:hypothetical protein